MLTFTFAWPLLNCKGFPLGEKGFNLFMEDISVNPKSYSLYDIDYMKLYFSIRKLSLQ